MTAHETPYRIEHDSLGEVSVPATALWGAQTQRAVANFPISGVGVPPPVIHALARIKAAAAQVNTDLGVISTAQGAAIVAAATEVALASLEGTPVHPNDHVNAAQSSNDTFPSAIHVAAATTVHQELLPALAVLEKALGEKAVEFAGLVKAGRTHLMDATPVTLGQEFGGYAATLTLAQERLAALQGDATIDIAEDVLPRVQELPLCGTAVGTGINAPPGFAGRVIAILARDSGIAFHEARDHFEAQGTRDSLVELSGVLRTIAVGLTKICNDLRWLASGPMAGLAEIHLPDLQPGSSIMPGKVNPVVPEATLQVCAQVIGNDATVAWAGATSSST